MSKRFIAEKQYLYRYKTSRWNMSHLRPVTISYSALTFGGKKEDLQQQVFHALGTHKGALGIALISGKYSTWVGEGNELINVCRSASSIPLSSREALPISSPTCKYARKRTGKARKAGNVSHVWLVPWQEDDERGEYKGNPGCILLITQYKRGHITPIHSWITQLSPMRLGWHTRNTMPETSGQKGMSGLEDFEQAFKE